MEKCMGEIKVAVFLNDFVVLSRTLEEHNIKLTKVLSHIKEKELKLSQEKCKFFQSSLWFLGHVVSEQGADINLQNI